PAPATPSWETIPPASSPPSSRFSPRCRRRDRVLRLIELQKRFGDTVVVDRLSLDVARGERVVLLGGSGSGKTTTLKMVNRLIEPDAGRIEIDGVDAVSLPAHQLRRKIGYCFQQV